MTTIHKALEQALGALEEWERVDVLGREPHIHRESWKELVQDRNVKHTSAITEGRKALAEQAPGAAGEHVRVQPSWLDGGAEAVAMAIEDGILPAKQDGLDAGNCKMCEWIKGASLHPKYVADRMAGAGHTCESKSPSTAADRLELIESLRCIVQAIQAGDAELLEAGDATAIREVADLLQACLSCCTPEMCATHGCAAAAAILQSPALPVRELTTGIPHSLAGFRGAFESEHKRKPTEQEIWNHAIRSWRDLNPAAARSQPASEQASASGWMLVPVEPTQEMKQSAMAAWMTRRPFEEVYRAMLAAAPEVKP